MARRFRQFCGVRAKDAVLLVRELCIDSIQALVSYHSSDQWDTAFREICDNL
jgi:hypothetical protein